MDLTPEEKTTIDSYNRGAETWSSTHSDSNTWAEEFIEFKKYLPKGHVLEVGCGGGRDAKVLLSMEYKYTGTDIAKEFVRVAKKNNPKGTFLVQSLYNLTFPDNSFDGFWSSAVFLHIPKKKISKALSEIHRVVGKGGVGFIATKKGKGEHVLEEESLDREKYTRFWAFYSKAEFVKILKQNRFKMLSSKVLRKSARTTWLIYFVQVEK